jgi:hypothetical protein
MGKLKYSAAVEGDAEVVIRFDARDRAVCIHSTSVEWSWKLEWLHGTPRSIRRARDPKICLPGATTLGRQQLKSTIEGLHVDLGCASPTH